MRVNKFELPIIGFMSGVTLKPSCTEYNIIPMCFSEKYNAWFNYNCICEETQYRIILWASPEKLDIRPSDGLVVFCSVIYTGDKLMHLKDDEYSYNVYSYNVEDIQILKKNESMNVGRFIETLRLKITDLVCDYRRIMIETVHLESVPSELNQDFLMVYPVDKNNVQLRLAPVTYYYNFEDKEFFTWKLFPLGQKEMLSVCKQRTTVDLSTFDCIEEVNTFFQFRYKGCYQDYIIVDNECLFILDMTWDKERKEFYISEVWVDEIDDEITISFVPEEDDAYLVKNRLITSVTKDTLIPKIKITESGIKKAVLTEYDFA